MTEEMALHESQFALPMSLTEEDIVEMPSTGRNWFTATSVYQIKLSMIAILSQETEWVEARRRIENDADSYHTPEAYVYTFENKQE